MAALLESAPAPALQAAAGRGAGIGRMGVLWGLAGSLDQVTGEQLQVSTFKPWLGVKAVPLQAAEPAPAPATAPEQCETAYRPDREPPSELGRAWLSLLQSGRQSDLSVLCSSGEEVAAHSLVLVCRAPALLPAWSQRTPAVSSSPLPSTPAPPCWPRCSSCTVGCYRTPPRPGWRAWRRTGGCHA